MHQKLCGIGIEERLCPRGQVAESVRGRIGERMGALLEAKRFFVVPLMIGDQRKTVEKPNLLAQPLLLVGDRGQKLKGLGVMGSRTRERGGTAAARMMIGDVIEMFDAVGGRT